MPVQISDDETATRSLNFVKDIDSAGHLQLTSRAATRRWLRLLWVRWRSAILRATQESASPESCIDGGVVITIARLSR